jgi:hypothetical protein
MTVRSSVDAESPSASEGKESDSPRSDDLEAQAVVAESKARIHLIVQARPALTRRQVVGRAMFLSATSWVLALALFELFGGLRPTGRATSLILGTSLGTAALALIASWAALTRGRSSLDRSPRLLLPITLSAPLLVLLWKVSWSLQYDGALVRWETRPGFKCLQLTLAIAACPLLSFFFGRRFTDARNPALTGLSAGLAIGALANVFTDLWCPVAYVPHLLLGHVVPVIILGVAGASISRHVTARR